MKNVWFAVAWPRAPAILALFFLAMLMPSCSCLETPDSTSDGRYLVWEVEVIFDETNAGRRFRICELQVDNPEFGLFEIAEFNGETIWGHQPHFTNSQSVDRFATIANRFGPKQAMTPGQTNEIELRTGEGSLLIPSLFGGALELKSLPNLPAKASLKLVKSCITQVALVRETRMESNTSGIITLPKWVERQVLKIQKPSDYEASDRTFDLGKSHRTTLPPVQAKKLDAAQKTAEMEKQKLSQWQNLTREYLAQAELLKKGIPSPGKSADTYSENLRDSLCRNGAHLMKFLGLKAIIVSREVEVIKNVGYTTEITRRKLVYSGPGIPSSERPLDGFPENFKSLASIEIDTSGKINVTAGKSSLDQGAGSTDAELLCKFLVRMVEDKAYIKTH